MRQDQGRRTRVLHLVLQLGMGGMEAMVASLAAGADRERFDVEAQLKLEHVPSWISPN